MDLTNKNQNSSSRAMPIGGSAPILGPSNAPLERENPDVLEPPATDRGTIPNLKFSFASAHNRITTGGWAREVTARELQLHTRVGRGQQPVRIPLKNR